jgi:hypothetical protein
LGIKINKHRRSVGVKVDGEERGIDPKDWSDFGPVVKMIEEFKIA